VHGGHGHHGEGFVDLVEVDLIGRPAGLGQQFLHGADRGGREQRRCMGVGLVADDAGDWRQARASRPARRASAPCAAAPSEIDEELAGVTVPSLREGRLQRRDLFDVDRERAFVLVDDDVTLAPLTVTGAISQSKLPSLLAALERVVEQIANSSCAWRVKP
jgi:hypothetical protein